MIDNELRRLQLTQLEIAKEIKRVCEENGIKYFMLGGTLLGAVRHKGFIPWDDDLDLGMLRHDYEKFLEIAPEKMKKDYFLQTCYTDKGYGLVFAKVQKKNTIYLEKIAEKTSAQHGIFVDIFPLDNYPEDAKAQKKQGKRITVTKKILIAKLRYAPWKENVKFNLKKYIIYLPLRVIAIFYNKERLIRYHDKVAVEYNNMECENVIAKGIEPYGTLLYQKKWFDELIDMEFEDTTLKCAMSYDELLKNQYGDYMMLPPEGKRENRHGVLKLEFGVEQGE